MSLSFAQPNGRGGGGRLACDIAVAGRETAQDLAGQASPRTRGRGGTNRLARNGASPSLVARRRRGTRRCAAVCAFYLYGTRQSTEIKRVDAEAQIASPATAHRRRRSRGGARAGSRPARLARQQGPPRAAAEGAFRKVLLFRKAPAFLAFRKALLGRRRF